MYKVVIIGGGAAGLMASYSAAMAGKSVCLIEKNEKLGKKIYITGKGRCNLTNDVSVDEFFPNVVTNPKFLLGAIYSFSPQKTIELFENIGLPLKTERGNRVFPMSDKASDVTKILEKKIISLGVDVKLSTKVEQIEVSNKTVCGVITDKGKIECESVIVCTGGISYPLTGSTGDGYKFAKQLGHSIVSPRSALVGIELMGNEYLDLQGISLKNVELVVQYQNKTVFKEFGEMLFTHFGISGPITLSCSSFINKFQPDNLTLSIDLKPALSFDVLDNRLVREFKENKTKDLFNVMRLLLPKGLINVFLKRANLNGKKNCSQITLEERRMIVNLMKKLTFKIKKLRPIDEAIITSGGVNVKEINPKTMESRLCAGLFFAGEVIDVDALTGGFNLQIAFSTGYIAGNNS